MPSLGAVRIAEPMDIEVGLKQLDVAEDVQRAVMEKGYLIQNRPGSGFIGILPDSITTLDDDELGELLNKLSGWGAYVQSDLVAAETKMQVVKEQLEFIQSQIRIAVRAQEGKMTAQDKTDMMNTHPKVVEAKARYIYCYSYYEYVKAIRDKAQKDWETVSRRITQRGQGIDRARRAESVANVNPQFTKAFRR